jgi:hypothetical protein
MKRRQMKRGLRKRGQRERKSRQKSRGGNGGGYPVKTNPPEEKIFRVPWPCFFPSTH